MRRKLRPVDVHDCRVAIDIDPSLQPLYSHNTLSASRFLSRCVHVSIKHAPRQTLQSTTMSMWTMSTHMARKARGSRLTSC